MQESGTGINFEESIPEKKFSNMFENQEWESGIFQEFFGFLRTFAPKIAWLSPDRAENRKNITFFTPPLLKKR